MDKTKKSGFINKGRILELCRKAFSDHDKVIFAYLFGSYSRNDSGPLSDLDLAVMLDEKTDQFNYRLRLMDRISRILGSEHFDLVILNHASPGLKFEVIKNGIVLKESRLQRVNFEKEVLTEYLDTRNMRNLQLRLIRNRMRQGVHIG